MKVVILAGGYGTRITEETHLKPKPMIEVGGKPVLWHILKLYSHFGFHEFVICCGYKGYLIKEYFANYFLHMSDVTFDMVQNQMEVHQKYVEPWRVTLVDTGLDTQTAGRLKRVKSFLNPDESFCFTYGDGLADVDIRALVAFHEAQGKLATLTAVQPPGRFGALNLSGDQVSCFEEKPQGDGAWINGGFFVLKPDVIDLIPGDKSSWEIEILNQLAQQGELTAFKHRGFWKPMDTLRDKMLLEDLWQHNQARWKLWEY